MIDGELAMKCHRQIGDVSARHYDQRVRGADLAVKAPEPDSRRFVLVLPIARLDLKEEGGERGVPPDRDAGVAVLEIMAAHGAYPR